jgi:alpha-mannosidase
MLWALKPAEEGIDKGIIARVWNLTGEPRPFSLSLGAGLVGAKRTTHIETDLAVMKTAGNSVSIVAAPWQMLTFRLLPPPPASHVSRGEP